ncbi:MAG: HEAT repeat domain-containing protein, partial [Pyrinomonadaceae bacterium]|nr:HEAT repeat domain-containing protein [Pyrinomonadaceae bacterium]
IRPALLDVLRTCPFVPNYFKRVRHIFKSAEYRHDAEVYGLIAYRFEKEWAMFRNSYYALNAEPRWSFLSLGLNNYIEKADKEIKKSDSKIAYGSRTRAFFRRRVWRTLRRLGELGDTEYVRMAVGVLLPYTDADAQPPKESTFHSWQTGQSKTVRWDAYAGYVPFNHILYTNSPRYTLKPPTTAWRCRVSYKPGDPLPESREEAFPEMWERVPVGLLHLISESNCLPVHEFAVKALRSCQEFCAELDTEAIIMILSRPYDVTARLGFELAAQRYNPSSPDRALVLAVLNCVDVEARTAALNWVDERRDYFLRDGDFLVSLITSVHADVRLFARNLLFTAVMSDGDARLLIGRLISYLLSLGTDQSERARDISDTLLRAFGVHLRGLGFHIVLDLLNHPMVEVQELGGQILLNYEISARELPDELYERLINSPFEQIRAIGIKLLGQLPDAELLARENALVSLITHELSDVRNAISPIIRGLRERGANLEFPRRLAALLIGVLLVPEAHQGVHASLVRLLEDDLGNEWVSEVGKEIALRLIQSQSIPAQELGGKIIAAKVTADKQWAYQFETD